MHSFTVRTVVPMAVNVAASQYISTRFSWFSHTDFFPSFAVFFWLWSWHRDKSDPKTSYWWKILFFCSHIKMPRPVRAKHKSIRRKTTAQTPRCTRSRIKLQNNLLFIFVQRCPDKHTHTERYQCGESFQRWCDLERLHEAKTKYKHLGDLFNMIIAQITSQHTRFTINCVRCSRSLFRRVRKQPTNESFDRIKHFIDD